MAKRGKRALTEADRFRAIAVSLMCISHPDWTEWEWEWLEDEVRRPDDYIYTDTERDKLNQLVGYSKTFTHYAGYSIQELLKISYPYRADFDEDDEGFLNKLKRWGAIDLKLRQVRRLARLCRCFEHIELDKAATMESAPQF